MTLLPFRFSSWIQGIQSVCLTTEKALEPFTLPNQLKPKKVLNLPKSFYHFEISVEISVEISFEKNLLLLSILVLKHCLSPVQLSNWALQMSSFQRTTTLNAWELLDWIPLYPVETKRALQSCLLPFLIVRLIVSIIGSAIVAAERED